MLKNIFGSINKSVVITAIVVVILAGATLFEREFGSDITQKLLYHSWLLWSLFIFGAATVIYQVFIVRKLSFHRLYSIFLHGSFVFIICGAMITHFSSQEGFLMLRQGKQSNVVVDEQKLPIANLPFSVRLEGFNVERYGGSGMPSNYISKIIIIDGHEAQYFTVSMNKIVRYGGYKLYQSSYDGDEQGSVLLVNNDYWGTLVTYIGYALLMLGMTLIPFSRQSRFKALLKKLTIIVILLSSTLTAEAQITKQNIKDLSYIPVQAANGRIEPFSTFANNTMQKLYGDRSYNGIKSEVIVMDMLAGNTIWQTAPIIELASKNLQKHLNKGDLYVTYGEFFSAEGRYLLDDVMGDIYKKKQDRLSRTDKELLKLDERIDIVYQLYAQMLPAIIPVSNSDQKWLSLAHAKSHGATKLGVEFENIINLFGSNSGGEIFSNTLEEFAEQQRDNTVVENRIARSRLVCEAWYNNFNLVFFSAILVIVMGVMGIITFLMGVVERKPIIVAFEKVVKIGVLIAVLALTFNIALRWYVAGRVPMSNSYETLLCVAWTLLFVGWLSRRISIFVVSAISFVAGCFLMISYVGGLDPQITPLVPVLNSHWLLFHVATIAVSYGLFALSAVMGIMYMVLKAIAPYDQNIDKMSIKMTALNELSQLVGVAFLTIGIFLGAIWANVSWGRYWGWDPKETWALITMFVYVVNIHLYMSKSLYSNFLINLLSIFGIGFVLMTFFGVNYLFGGMHAYGGDHDFPLTWIISIMIVLIILAAIVRVRTNGRKHATKKDKEG